MYTHMIRMCVYIHIMWGGKKDTDLAGGPSANAFPPSTEAGETGPTF